MDNDQNKEIEAVGLSPTSTVNPSPITALPTILFPSSYQTGPLQTSFHFKTRSPSSPQLHLSIRPHESTCLQWHIPITRATLRQLDISIVLQNPIVRHNMLFDPNLALTSTANDSPLGKLKQQSDLRFWSQVSKECAGYYDDAPPYSYHPPNLAILPPLLTELRLILTDLLLPAPDLSIKDISHLLDIKQATQEWTFNGYYNLTPIVQFILSRLAPLSTPEIKPLVETFMEASQQQPYDYGHFFKLCFELLEKIKLDKLNKSLLKVRPYVFETAAKFEKRVFMVKVKEKKVKLVKTAKWLRRSWDHLQDLPALDTSSSVNADMVFHHGIVQLLETPSSTSQDKIPEIFGLDMQRIHAFALQLKRIHRVACVLVVLSPYFKDGPSENADAVPSKLQSCQKTFWTLFGADPSAVSLDHILDQMLCEVNNLASGSVLGSSLPSQNASTSKALRNFFQNSLSPDGIMYKVMREKLYSLLYSFLQNSNPFSKTQLAKLGLLPLEKELEDFAVSIYKFSTHNKNVYSDILNLLYSKLFTS